jgi:hypothetical protein
VRATIHNADRTREVLNSQVVPQASGAPGFKVGYWTWPTGEGELNVLAMIVSDSEENAAHHAFVTGFNTIALVSVAVAAVGSVAGYALVRSRDFVVAPGQVAAPPKPEPAPVVQR